MTHRFELPPTPERLQRAASYGWRVLVLGAVAYYALQVLGTLRGVLLPLVLSFFVAAALDPAVRALERWRVPRMVASGALLTLLAGLVLGTLTAVGVTSAQTADERSFRANLRRGWSRLTEYAGDALPGLDGADVRGFVERAGEATGSSVDQVVAGALTVGTLAAGVGFTFFFAFYLLSDAARIRSFLLERCGDRRDEAREIASVVYDKIGGFVRGVSALATINALLVGATMWALDLPLIAPIMALMFVGSFIPFAGPIVTAVAAGLLAVAEQGPITALLMLGALGLIQALEGNVLQPLIVGKSVHLHPVVVLLVVGIGAAAFGLAGAFLAVPVTASLYALSDASREHRERSRDESSEGRADQEPDTERPTSERDLGAARAVPLMD